MIGWCRSWLAGDRLRSSRKFCICVLSGTAQVPILRLLRSRSPASQLLQKPIAGKPAPTGTGRAWLRKRAPPVECDASLGFYLGGLVHSQKHG